jgi:hypothetical protein
MVSTTVIQGVEQGVKRKVINTTRQGGESLPREDKDHMKVRKRAFQAEGMACAEPEGTYLVYGEDD